MACSVLQSAALSMRWFSSVCPLQNTLLAVRFCTLRVEFKMPSEQPELTEWDVKHLRLGVTAAGVALWSWNVDTDKLNMDGFAYRLWGVPLHVDVSFEDLSLPIHPADRDRVRAAFAAFRPNATERPSIVAQSSGILGATTMPRYRIVLPSSSVTEPRSDSKLTTVSLIQRTPAG
jgi:hypothetical protein